MQEMGGCKRAGLARDIFRPAGETCEPSTAHSRWEIELRPGKQHVVRIVEEPREEFVHVYIQNWIGSVAHEKESRGHRDGDGSSLIFYRRRLIPGGPVTSPCAPTIRGPHADQLVGDRMTHIRHPSSTTDVAGLLFLSGAGQRSPGRWPCDLLKVMTSFSAPACHVHSHGYTHLWMPTDRLVSHCWFRHPAPCRISLFLELRYQHWHLK